MVELTLLRNQSAPRDQALVADLGRRFEPAAGFVLYGLLYVWVVPSSASLATIGLVTSIGDRALGTGTIAAAGLAAFALACWPFARWFRKRRALARRLFGESDFAEGRIARTVRVRRLLSRHAILTRVPRRAHAWRSEESGVHRCRRSPRVGARLHDHRAPSAGGPVRRGLRRRSRAASACRRARVSAPSRSPSDHAPPRRSRRPVRPARSSGCVRSCRG